MIPVLLSTLVLALGADGPPEAPPEMPDPTRFSILELQGEYEKAVRVYGVRWALIRIAWLWNVCGQPEEWTMSNFRQEGAEVNAEQRSLAHLFFIREGTVGSVQLQWDHCREGLRVVHRSPGTEGSGTRMLAWRSGYASVDWPGPPEEIQKALALRNPRIEVTRWWPYFTPCLRWDGTQQGFYLAEDRSWVETFSSSVGPRLFEYSGLLSDQVKQWSVRWGVRYRP